MGGGGREGGREYHDFLPIIFCLTARKTFVKDSFMFHYFGVSKNFTLNRNMRGFSVDFFSSCSTKKFLEVAFCVSENFWYPKMLGIGDGAGITIFRQNCFVSQYRIISLRKLFVSQKGSKSTKPYAEEGNITISDRKFVVLQFGKTTQVNFSVFHRSYGVEKFHG